MALKPVIHTVPGKATVDGAGVKLRRIHGKQLAELFDPFLLLDEFKSEHAEDYAAGFPWHPHRGIETVTYLIHGRVEHGDSLGNSGVIGDGDCQWMTAGSGIIHQEMPQESELMWGYQLWVNLPSWEKMCEPKYRDILASDIQEKKLPEGGFVKILAGRYDGIEGPVKGIPADPVYLDVSVSAGASFEYCADPAHNVFACVIDGSGRMTPDADADTERGTLVFFGEGDRVEMKAGDSGLRLLLLAGKPLKEPIAWGGPIVMNTQEELVHAFEEYRQGTFIKHG